MSLESDVLAGGLTDAKRLLREDDSLLRQIFFSVLRHHHPNLANKVSASQAATQWAQQALFIAVDLTPCLRGLSSLGHPAYLTPNDAALAAPPLASHTGSVGGTLVLDGSPTLAATGCIPLIIILLALDLPFVLP